MAPQSKSPQKHGEKRKIMCIHVERKSLSLDNHVSEMNISYISMEMEKNAKYLENIEYHNIQNDSTLEILKQRTESIIKN